MVVTGGAEVIGLEEVEVREVLVEVGGTEVTGNEEAGPGVLPDIK